MRPVQGIPTAAKPPSGSPLSPISALPSALPRKGGSCSASPHASPRHRPVPVARVSPAVKQIPNGDDSKSPTTNGKMGYGEELKNWGEVEGTPLGFSTATSLSDLTVESCDQRVGSCDPRPLKKSETPQPYATEDTPASLSRCHSLSSLSCEDDVGQVTCRLAPQRRVTAQPAAQHNVHEVPVPFSVEDTPAVLSRQSSLSSIDGTACTTATNSKPGISQRTRPEASTACNFSGIEDTPVCFSRNSSLSSLSVESYPEETTPSEQALLQHCINQGMPTGDQRVTRANTARGNKRAKSGSRIPGLSQSPGRSPARNIPGVPMQRLHLVPINTTSTEAESSKLRSELEQSEKKQFTSSEDDPSGIDDITEVTEPVSDVTTAPIAEAVARKPSAKAAGATSCGGTNSSPEEKQSSGDETRGSSGRGADKSSWGSGQCLGSDVSMTDSMIVATEALRVARAVEVQGQEGRSSDDASIMSQSITSEGLLENIPAPSVMESVMSLSSSLNDEQQRTQQQPVRKAIECRHTRKIPTIVRRALGDQEVTDMNGTNGGSLASSCHSNLDNVIPPSFMEADDMESSMISVASITSEVADPRHSPPSMASSIPSEAMAAIEAPAQLLAKMFLREARHQASTVTLTAGEDTSTCQEVTELDRDETLGRVDTATDTDHATDDIPADIPDLPQDSPIHRGRNSPQVTPSMLRKAVQNDTRFRTFSKGERPSNHQIHSNGISQIEPNKSISSSRLTPRQKRAEHEERFRTRTLSTEEDQEVETPTTPKNEEPFGAPRQRRSLREKRVNNPVRYQTRTIESVSSQNPEAEGVIEFRDGAELDLTADQIEALSQDANIVICTLNENREANTADLLHGLSQENILDIETLSLISSDEEDNTFDVNTPPGAASPARPRIVKPGEQSYSTQEEDGQGAAKGIRGRRKGLYPGISKVTVPVKPTLQSSTSPRVIATQAAAFRPTPRNQAPPPIAVSTAPPQPGSPKLPRATRASELRQKAGRVGSSSSSSPASSAGSSPRMGAGTRPRQPPPSAHITQHIIKRQNTFTKEDLEEQAKAKARYRKDAVQPTPIQPRTSSKAVEVAATRAGQPKSCSLTRDVRPPSANDVADWNKDSKPGKVVKKDVGSRIANLWKKVEKAQNASKPKENDARIWISKSKTKTPDQNSPPPLVRSSTYEKLTIRGESRSDSERTDTSKSKTRLGLKLSRLRGRDTKSSPPSEVNTPVDPRPQCMVSPSRVTTAGRPRLSLANSRSPSCEFDQLTPDGRRLSRLGSFVLVDGEDDRYSSGGSVVGIRSPPLSAVVAPFNYHPPGSPGGSRQRREDRSSTPGPGGTRIPLPAVKGAVISNNPGDDNGNAPYV